MKEWKEIEFTEGRYSCSSDGEIRSNKSGKMLNGTLSPDGYRQIGLVMPNGKQKSFQWHRVIAMTWHPNPEGFAQVDHLNKDKLDNRPCNLEWVTSKENLMRRDNVTVREVVILVSPEGKEVEVESSYSVAKEYELHIESVRKLMKGMMKKHKGWTVKEGA